MQEETLEDKCLTNDAEELKFGTYEFDGSNNEVLNAKTITAERGFGGKSKNLELHAEKVEFEDFALQKAEDATIDTKTLTAEGYFANDSKNIAVDAEEVKLEEDAFYESEGAKLDTKTLTAKDYLGGESKKLTLNAEEVKLEDYTLRNSEDTTIDTKTITAGTYFGDNSDNLTINAGEVKLEDDAFMNSKNATIDTKTITAENSFGGKSKHLAVDAEEIKLGADAFCGSEDATINTKTLTAKGYFANDSKNIAVDAEEVKLEDYTLRNSEGAKLDTKTLTTGSSFGGKSKNLELHAEKVEFEDFALQKAEDATIDTKTLTAKDRFASYSKNIAIDANKIQASNLFALRSESLAICAEEVKLGDEAFCGSEDATINTKTLTAINKFGDGSKNLELHARDITLEATAFERAKNATVSANTLNSKNLFANRSKNVALNAKNVTTGSDSFIESKNAKIEVKDLLEAQNSFAKEAEKIKVTAKTAIFGEKSFEEAEDVKIRAKNICFGDRAFYEAENLNIEAETLSTGKEFAKESEDVKIRAKNIDFEEYAIHYAEDSEIKAEETIAASFNFAEYAKNLKINSENLFLESNAFDSAENTVIKAKQVVVGSCFAEDAQNIHIEAETIKAGNDFAHRATNLLLITDNLEFEGELNLLYGSARLIAAGKIKGELKNIENTSVLTEENYTSSWNELSTYLKQETKKEKHGQLKALELLRLEQNKYNSLIELKEELAKLNERYSKVETNFEKYKDLEEILTLDMNELSNEEKCNFLSNFKEEVIPKIKNQYDLSEENAESLFESKNIGLIVKTIDSIELNEKLSKNDFIKIFSDHEKAREYQTKEFNLMGESVPEEYLTFNQSYQLALQKEENKDKDITQINNELYQRGVTLIEQVRQNKITLNINSPEIQQYVQEKQNLTEQIKNAYITKNTANAKALLTDKKDLESKLLGLKKNATGDLLNKLNLKRNPTIDELQHGLSQLAQHYLSGKPKQTATDISKELVVTENELSDNVLQVSVWDKDFKNMPTYNDGSDNYQCCTFLGGIYPAAIFAYMAAPEIQMLKATVGDKKGMAICYKTTGILGENVLLVDSVEADNHMFANKNVTRAFDEAIQDYARKSDFDRVVYVDYHANNSWQEFRKNLEGETEENPIKLDDSIILKETPELVLESKGSEAYVRRLTDEN
jgi:hypothetical protein